MANIHLKVLESISFTLETLKYAEAERNYYLKLSSGSGGGGEYSPPQEKKSNQECNQQEKAKSIETSTSTTTTTTTSIINDTISISQQIAQARQQIQSSLKGQNICSHFHCGVSHDDLEMKEENTRLKKEIDDLRNQVKQLTGRVTKLEEIANVKNSEPTGGAGDSAPSKKEEDDDVDLFGSEDEEDSAEAQRIKEERVAAYAAKKSKKPALIAKSNVILDVKPWDDETDMKLLEEGVRKIVMDGLLWGTSKLVPLAYGIKKLTISSVVEDEKVSIDELCEKIQENEDFVQSVDIAAFNKI